MATFNPAFIVEPCPPFSLSIKLNIEVFLSSLYSFINLLIIFAVLSLEPSFTGIISILSAFLHVTIVDIVFSIYF